MSAFNKLAMELFNMMSEDMSKTARDGKEDDWIDPFSEGGEARIKARKMKADALAKKRKSWSDERSRREKTRSSRMEFSRKVKARAEYDRKNPRPVKTPPDRGLGHYMRESAKDISTRPARRFGANIAKGYSRGDRAIERFGANIARSNARGDKAIRGTANRALGLVKSIPERLSKQVSNARAMYNMKPGKPVGYSSDYKKVNKMSEGGLLSYRSGSKPPKLSRAGGNMPKSFAYHTEGRSGPIHSAVAREKFFASKKK